jgi:hypothetical protein
MLALIRHSYCVSSPLAIAGLGFAGALAAACAEFGFAFPAAAAIFRPLFGAADAAIFGLALDFHFVCRTRPFRCPALATFFVVTGLLAAVLLATGFAGLGFSTNGGTVFTVTTAGGLGAVLMRVIRAAGFTPAAIALLAASGEIGGCLAVPCKSGLTMICRS